MIYVRVLHYNVFAMYVVTEKVFLFYFLHNAIKRF